MLMNDLLKELDITKDLLQQALQNFNNADSDRLDRAILDLNYAEDRARIAALDAKRGLMKLIST
jgi:hypothetical protein